MGNQQEVLQAQLERTKLLREITMNQLEPGKIQAESSSFSTAHNPRPTSRRPNSRKLPLPTPMTSCLPRRKPTIPKSLARKKWSRARIAGGPCEEGFLPGFQPSIHVAADRPLAIPRLLPGDTRRPHSDLSRRDASSPNWLRPKRTETVRKVNTKRRRNRSRSSFASSSSGRKNRRSCSRFTAKD